MMTLFYIFFIESVLVFGFIAWYSNLPFKYKICLFSLLKTVREMIDSQQRPLFNIWNRQIVKKRQKKTSQPANTCPHFRGVCSPSLRSKVQADI